MPPLSNWAEAMTHLKNVSAVLITREPEWPVEARVDFPFAQSIVVPSCPSVFRRFEIAADAACETVYVQDDDVRLDIQALWTHYDGRITNVMPAGFQRMYAGTGVTLIGWGAFFPRSMAQTFVRQQDFWRREFGDQVFETEADRFFTFSHRPFNQIHMERLEMRRPGCMSDRPDHYNVRQRVFNRLKEMS
jgi:hypothetical protein